MAKTITEDEALAILARKEGQFWDDKSAKSGTGGGTKIEKLACSLANADGGEFGVGIEDRKQTSGIARWQGFIEQEDGNFIHQVLAQDATPGVPYSIEWLQIQGQEACGLVALVTVHKSASVHKTKAGVTWARRGAQDLRLDSQGITDLALSKGSRSYEDQMLEKYTADQLAAEPELASFLDSYSPTTASDDFVRKQRLVDGEHASVAGAVLYAEVPAAVVPKKCTIKVARYETKERAPEREHLAGTPLTIEGPARAQIDGAIDAVTEMIEAVSIMEPDGTLKPARYVRHEHQGGRYVGVFVHRWCCARDGGLLALQRRPCGGGR